jgi:pimeloyl-ACP methyl ester carboxylesterase
MLAHLQKLTTLGSLGLVGIWVFWFWSHGRPSLAIFGGLALLFSYAGVLALEFVLVRRVHGSDPAPKANARQLVRAWWNEVLVAPTVFCWNQPFRSRRHPDFLPTEVEKRGVILVSGYLCNRGFWNGWMPKLKSRGIPYIAPSLEPVFGSISEYAKSIDDTVRRMTETTGQTPVLVGHSMGGVAIRAWLHQCDGLERVHHIVTVGSPHHGTWLARFAMTRNAQEMATSHGWRKAMEAAETSAHRAKFTCFYSHCDNVVFPASNASLPGADNRHLEGMAHIHLNGHPAVFDEVIARLAQPPTGR